MREGRNFATKTADDPERLMSLQRDLLHANNVSGIFYPLDEETGSLPVNPSPDINNFAVPPKEPMVDMDAAAKILNRGDAWC